MADPMSIAQTLLGRGEVPDRAAIQDYLQTGGVNLDPVTTAWCAAYVNSTLKQAGFEGTGSNMARSFLNYGEKVDQPQKGDLAVFSRGDPNGPYGHVGFFDSQNPDGTIRVLGGNQGNAVSYGNYPADRLLGYRRPVAPGAPPQSISGVGSPNTPQPQSGLQPNDMPPGLLSGIGSPNNPQLQPQSQPMMAQGGDAWGGMRDTTTPSPTGGTNLASAISALQTLLENQGQEQQQMQLPPPPEPHRPGAYTPPQMLSLLAPSAYR